MKNLTLPIYPKSKSFKQLLILAVVVFLIGLSGYFVITNWQSIPENAFKFPAAIFSLNDQEEEAEAEDQEIILDEDKINETFFPLDLDEIDLEKHYREKAKPGEGITHLARRAVTQYLQDQNANVLPEHRIYAEDYIAKQMGSPWLELEQEVEIPLHLIAEALQNASELSEQDLDNLSQFAELVSF